MKIIAQTTPNNNYSHSYLVEMKDDEIARLLGFYSQGEGCPKITIGAEFNIHRAYEAMKNLAYQTGVNNYNLSTKANDLRKLADSLDKLNTSILEPAEIAKQLQ